MTFRKDHADAQLALTQCDDILQEIGDLPDGIRSDPDRDAFLDSVAKGVAGVARTVTEQQKVSDKQRVALNNWQAGVRSCLQKFQKAFVEDD